MEMVKYYVLSKQPPYLDGYTSLSGCVAKSSDVRFYHVNTGTKLSNCYQCTVEGPDGIEVEVYCRIEHLLEITEEQYNNPLFRALAKATYGVP